jgi:hypothetical protein
VREEIAALRMPAASIGIMDRRRAHEDRLVRDAASGLPLRETTGPLHPPSSLPA